MASEKKGAFAKKQSKKGAGQHSKHPDLPAGWGRQIAAKPDPRDSFAPSSLFFPKLMRT